MSLKNFILPVIPAFSKRSGRYSELFDSFREALSTCEDGYIGDRLVDVVYEKTKMYRDHLLSMQPQVADIGSLRPIIGIALAASQKQMNIIDFGGACGVHYFLAKALLGDQIALKWHVVETPKMAAKARDLEDGQLRFFCDLGKAKNEMAPVDLVFSSGAIQYLPTPYQILGKLCDLKAQNIFITRTGLTTRSKELISVQESKLSANGPGLMPEGMEDGTIRYPVTFVRKDKFEEILSQTYSIKMILSEENGAYKAGNYSIDLYGYFGSLRAPVP